MKASISVVKKSALAKTGGVGDVAAGQHVSARQPRANTGRRRGGGGAIGPAKAGDDEAGCAQLSQQSASPNYATAAKRGGRGQAVYGQW